MVELAVADNGGGILPHVQERMFEPFFSTKDVGKGSGMGLATVHGIVHEHGGHIVVESATDVGSTFRVLLPALPGDGAPRIRAPVAPDAFPRARLAGRVAVVDDEMSVALFMADLLGQWGVTATTFANGREMLDSLATGSGFDLVITDHTMPGMTGLELARELHASRPGLPVVLYTGYGDGITATDVEHAGVVALVRKPIDTPALLTVLSKHLRQTTAA